MPGRSHQSQEYRFGFNGMEQDDEFDGVTGSKLDFGARIYDSRLGRWLSLDPLATKYPSLSAYNFVAGNPILCVDPDGQDIRIHYEVKNKNTGKTEIRKFDFNGTNANAAPKNSFVQNVIKAYDYNVNNGGGQNMKIAAGSDKIYDLENGSGSLLHGNSAPKGGAVKWNPSQGLLIIATDNKGNEEWRVLSPATGLEHEFDHKVNEGIESDRLKEESRVINGSETTTAKANGEIHNDEKIKDNYENYEQRMGVVISGGVTSKSISKEGTKNKINKLNDAGYETKQYDVLKLK